jgi:hypothetical protein
MTDHWRFNYTLAKIYGKAAKRPKTLRCRQLWPQ